MTDATVLRGPTLSAGAGPLRLAMVGGGPGAFIGPVHRMAAELDGAWSLAAGAFSRNDERNRQAGRAWGVDPARTYADWRDLIREEAARPDGVHAVAIVTPNHLHFPVAKAALEAGLHVVSDKPATATLAEAVELADVVARSGRRYALTHTYAGYPMVREARERVRAGAIGRVRKISVEYSQGWLATPLEQTGDRQASWRTDPSEAGLGGCIGDIGVHAFHIAEYVSGVRATSLCADLNAVVPGRALDDDVNVLLRFEGGAPGVLFASQIAAGERNGLKLKVHGETGSIMWTHERPDLLVIDRANGPTETHHAASGYLGPVSRASSRLPTGHPEGFIEAFANLYRDFARVIATGAPDPALPGIGDGVRGLTFVQRAVESSRARAWIDLGDHP